MLEKMNRLHALTALFAACFCLLATIAPAIVSADDNLLVNGDLTKGTGDSPDHWENEGWQTAAGVTSFTWNHSGAAPAELEVSNLKPNDARWFQKLHLDPGWYHFSAEMRAEGVAANITGANLSITEDGIISETLNGTTDWKTVGFYLKIDKSGADVVLACRVGGFAALNTGKVFCRDLKAVKVDQPGDAGPRYDLDVARGVTQPGEEGSSLTASSGTANNTSQVTVLFLASLAVLIGLFVSRGSETNLAKVLDRIRRQAAHRAPQARPQAPGEQPRREIEIALFMVCLLSFAYFYQASDHSTASRIDLIRALLERRTLWIDGYAGYNTADIVELHSHIYSNKAPGGAFTGLLPWTLVTGFLRIFSSPPSGFYWAFATYLTTVFTVSLIVAMMAVVVYRFALMLGTSATRAVALALTLAFATIMFPYATEFTSEPIAAFCTFLAFYLLALPQNEGDPWWRSLIPGLLAGWGVLCDYPTFLLAATVGGYAIWRLKGWRKILTFMAGAVVVADLLMAYNKFAFGSATFLSYEAYMLPGSDRFPEQAKGFAGVTYPRLPILWDILLDPQRGLFFCNPVLLLVIPGLYFFWRRRELKPEFIAIAIALLSLTILNASYGDSIIYWGGGTAVGPRHFVPVLPFAVLAMAFIPEGWNSLLGSLALVSAFLMLMVTAVEPHLPYEYSNPFRDFVWPAYLRGDFGYDKLTYFGGPPIAGDSAAFNLGKLIGLPGAIQLWPLAAIWIGGALYLVKTIGPARIASRRNLDRAAVLAIVAMVAPPTIGGLFGRGDAGKTHGLLGCYYEGLRPSGFPEHIRRVDELISFDNLAQLGALPSPSAVVWRGKIIAPVAGQYQFMITVDDLGWLNIDGKTVIADPGDIAKPNDAGSIYLTAGEHSIETGERNIWGEAYMRLEWQPPGGAQQLVPSENLIPDTGECRPG